MRRHRPPRPLLAIALCLGACAGRGARAPGGGGGSTVVGPGSDSLAPPSAALATEALPAGARLRFGTVRLRWRSPGQELLFSADGTTLVGVSLDETLRVWDARSGRVLHRLGPHRGKLLAGAVSPDSRLVAAGGYGDQVILWDLATGKQLHELAGLDVPRRVGFSADGKLLAVAAEGLLGHDAGVLVLFETTTWSEVARHSYGALTPITFRFTADGRLLAPAPGAGAALTDLLRPGAPVVELRAIPDDAGPVTISHDGQWLVAGDELDLHLWSVDSGERRVTLPAPARAERDWPRDWDDLAISPDDRLLAAGSGEIGTWVLPVDGAPPRRLGERASFGLGWSADGKVLALGTATPIVQLLSVSDGARLDRFPGHENELTDLAVSADGRVVATTGLDQTVRLWDARTGELRRTMQTARSPYAVALTGDGSRVLVGFDEPVVRVYDAAGDIIHERRVLDHGFISELALHSSGVLAVAGSDGVAFVDPTTLEPRQGSGSFDGFSLFGGVLSPDGRTIAVTDYHELLFFDRDGGRSAGAERPVAAHTIVLAWSPDGAQLLLSDAAGQLQLVPVEGGQPRLVLQQPRPLEADELPSASAAAFSPDGATLATAGYDGRISLWDLASGKLVRTLDGHDDAVDALVFAADGATLYSASRDTTALAWSLR